LWRLALVIALLAGWASGGSLKNLAKHQLRGSGLLFLVALLQLVIAAMGQVPALAQTGPLLHTLSYLPLFWVIWLNRHYLGGLVVGLGSLANFLVIAANGGRMPVSAEAIVRVSELEVLEMLRAGASFTHGLLSADTRLAWSADRFVFPDWLVFPHTVFSLGDAAMAAGLVIILWELMNRQPTTV